MDNYFYKNLYEILGIEPTDDTAKIKTAYRALARKYHPDLNDGNELFVKKFKEISQAYEILTDIGKKSHYDSFKGYNFTKSQNNNTQYKSNADQKSTQQNQNSANTQNKSKSKQQSTKSDFSDAFNGIIDGLFKSKKQNYNSKSQPQNGTDITTEVTISYQEALTGTKRTVNILHTEICPNCKGKMFLNGAKCPLCNGSGETSIHKKINVKIPKNVKQNTKIRIQNEGNRGRNGGKNGDVYLVVKIQNDEKYTYDGLNVNFETTIFPHEALLGTEIQVETPQGAVTMKIPTNTPQGQKFRLSAHGLKGENGKVGDAIVTVRIDLPQDMTEEEIELYRQIAKINKSREEKA